MMCIDSVPVLVWDNALTDLLMPFTTTLRIILSNSTDDVVEQYLSNLCGSLLRESCSPNPCKLGLPATLYMDVYGRSSSGFPAVHCPQTQHLNLRIKVKSRETVIMGFGSFCDPPPEPDGVPFSVVRVSWGHI